MQPPKINIKKNMYNQGTEAQRRRVTCPRPHSGLMAETKCKSASLNRGGTQEEVLWHTHAPAGISQVPHPGKAREPSQDEATVPVLPADPAHNQANLALEAFSARCWSWLGNPPAFLIPRSPHQRKYGALSL